MNKMSQKFNITDEIPKPVPIFQILNTKKPIPIFKKTKKPMPIKYQPISREGLVFLGWGTPKNYKL
jgi:hypothetical protein